MTNTIKFIKLNAAAVAAIEALAASGSAEERAATAALPVLRAQFAGHDRELAKATFAHNYATAVGIELKVQGTGRLVWPKQDDAARQQSLERAKRACNRFLVRLFEGEAGKATEPKARRVDAELLAKVQNIISRAGLTKADARDLFNAVIEAAY